MGSCKSHLTLEAKDPAQYTCVYTTAKKPEVINEAWAFFLVVISAYTAFFHWQVSIDFAKVVNGSPHLRDRKNEADFHVVLLRAACASQRQNQAYELRFPSQIFALPAKLHCLLVGTPSPAYSKFYEGTLANSFQSFPSVTVFFWVGKFPSRWCLTWHWFSARMWLLWQLLPVWWILVPPILCKHNSCISCILWKIKIHFCF